MRDFHIIKMRARLFQPEDTLMMYVASAGWLRHQLDKCNSKKCLLP
jgi:hypothetical protein